MFTCSFVGFCFVSVFNERQWENLSLYCRLSRSGLVYFMGIFSFFAFG